MGRTMNRHDAFALFELMISTAKEELFSFTMNSSLSIEQKADKSAVTACDKRIDEQLTQIVHQNGLQVVSEEGAHVVDIVKSGNYITIDPIDGTIGYIEYVNHALENEGLTSFGKKDLGAKSDFCLLLGIVEDGVPKYGAMYNYITQEKILLDGTDASATIRENTTRVYSGEHAVYFDQRFLHDEINKQLQEMKDVTFITQAAFGLKSLYTFLNPHTEAVTVHRVQSAGLWDVMPAAVAARAYGGNIYDDKGELLDCTSYIVLPGKGATALKGNKFEFVLESLRR